MSAPGKPKSEFPDGDIHPETRQETLGKERNLQIADLPLGLKEPVPEAGAQCKSPSSNK
jgi:hypothetical protein